MNFCSICGSPVKKDIPHGDDKLRYICTNQECRVIHYQNPKLIVGCLPIWKDKILLCKRSIEPRAGFWTIPAGYMENGESLEQASMRETFEESGATIDSESLELYSVISLSSHDEVHVFFKGNLISPNYSAGIESLEVKLFEKDEIPWNELAFKTVKQTLQLFLNIENTDLKKDIQSCYLNELQLPKVQQSPKLFRDILK